MHLGGKMDMELRAQAMTGKSTTATVVSRLTQSVSACEDVYTKLKLLSSI